jgi:hypothetical protein
MPLQANPTSRHDRVWRQIVRVRRQIPASLLAPTRLAHLPGRRPDNRRIVHRRGQKHR